MSLTSPPYNGDRSAAEQWIPKWTKEENLGVAILQRLQHVSHLENKVSGAENKNGNRDQDLKPIRIEKSRAAGLTHKSPPQTEGAAE
jgi:hypothetical protein